jgi:glycine cleavage system H protein
MNPTDHHYTKDHEWISSQESIATVGVTDYAQEQLGDVVFVELPKVGAQLRAGEAFGSIESVKAVNDLFAPASGEVTEIDEALTNAPELVNKDPYGAGWLLKIRLSKPEEISALMDAASYEAYTGDLAK